MADPFEVRMRFTTQLQHMNASISSAQKAAQYALKNRDMDEDLHSCILEQLEKSNLNVRANIMFFLEHLCDMSQRDQHPEFIKMIRRDIFAIVDSVAPADQGGAANVKVVRKVLAGLQAKHFLETQTVDELEAALAERTGASGVEGDDEDITMASPPAVATATTTMMTAPAVVNDRPADANANTNARVHEGSNSNGNNNNNSNSVNKSMARGGEGAYGPLKLGELGRPDKRQVEQRIEEDRERHKRLKESIWEVSGADDDEFTNAWEETSDIGDDDYAMAEEEADERNKCFELEAVEAREAGKA